MLIQPLLQTGHPNTQTLHPCLGLLDVAARVLRFFFALRGKLLLLELGFGDPIHETEDAVEFTVRRLAVGGSDQVVGERDEACCKVGLASFEGLHACWVIGILLVSRL